MTDFSFTQRVQFLRKPALHGTQLAGYQIDELLAEESSRVEVVHVIDTRTDVQDRDPVVAKCVRDDDGDAPARLEHEYLVLNHLAKLAKQGKLPAEMAPTPCAYGTSIDSTGAKWHVLVMTLALPGGQTFGKWLADNPINTREALLVRLRALIEVARRVDALHALGPEEYVVHRDLKPANLRIKPDRRGGRRPPSVTLIDFGISACGCSGAAELNAVLRHATAPYTEQVDETAEGVPDRRWDVFSLGWMLRKDVAPFLSDGEVSVPDDVPNRMIQSLRAIAEQAIRQDEKRLPSVLEFIARLENAIDVRRRMRRSAALAAILVGIVAVAAALMRAGPVVVPSVIEHDLVITAGSVRFAGITRILSGGSLRVVASEIELQPDAIILIRGSLKIMASDRDQKLVMDPRGSGEHPDATWGGFHLVDKAAELELVDVVVRHAHGFRGAAWDDLQEFDDFLPEKEGRGGAIGSWGGQVRILRCSFEKCTSRFGGALHLRAESSDPRVIQITESTFMENQSAGDGETGGGGAIFGFGDVTLAVMKCRFRDNAAHGIACGGAIYAGLRSTLDVEGDNEFIRNSAGGDGGAVYLRSTSETRWHRISGEVRFFQNLARSKGGAIAASEKTILMLRGALFEKNSAAVGGAIDFEPGGLVGTDLRDLLGSGQLILEECTFRDNEAKTCGSDLRTIVSFGPGNPVGLLPAGCDFQEPWPLTESKVSRVEIRCQFMTTESDPKRQETELEAKTDLKAKIAELNRGLENHEVVIRDFEGALEQIKPSLGLTIP